MYLKKKITQNTKSGKELPQPEKEHSQEKSTANLTSNGERLNAFSIRPGQGKIIYFDDFYFMMSTSYWESYAMQ